MTPSVQVNVDTVPECAPVVESDRVWLVRPEFNDAPPVQTSGPFDYRTACQASVALLARTNCLRVELMKVGA
jgi:hypothetical protein